MEISIATAYVKRVVGSTLDFTIVKCVDLKKLQFLFVLIETISKFWRPFFDFIRGTYDI